ncbi:uncharacterized protein DNG_03692 [Cephalotrichum gorgonifer]|uniref:Uncharacterized protein n=1 Tax=Cephalotrichum gorgonifer TaxID=2041049 RepID=A0AAE8STV7_9PEZI|nr:uncharacterized protein DNG_03692 [Cephalotrichum gorgonifer]
MESFELRSSRDKRTHEPVPPPYVYHPPEQWQATPHPPSFLGFYLVLPALVAASAVALGLKASVPKKNASDPRFGKWSDEDDVMMAQWPSSLFPNQDEIQIAVAALALATAVFASALLFFVVKGGPLQISYLNRLAIIVHTGLSAAVALAGTIYVFVLNSSTAIFDIEYAVSVAPTGSGTFIYDQGTFSKEGWSCSARVLKYFDADLGHVMAKTCSIEMGARWLSLLLFILSIALFSLLYLDARRGRFFMRS